MPKVEEDVAVDSALEKGVIGSGFGRTGTKSLMHALDDVGLGPTIHMLRILGYNPNDSLFRQVTRMLAFRAASKEKDKKKRQEHLRVAMQGYRSSVDFPASVFFEDLVEMYPNKKVVHTVRESAEAWFASADGSILRILKPTFERDPALWFFCKGTPPGLFMSYFFEFLDVAINTTDAAGIKRSYDEWNARVYRVVPPERLLTFDVKQGWEPLAKFLDFPVPDQPFPRVNDLAEINKAFDDMRTVAYCFIALYMVFGIVLGRRLVRILERSSKSKKAKRQ